MFEIYHRTATISCGGFQLVPVLVDLGLLSNLDYLTMLTETKVVSGRPKLRNTSQSTE